MVPTSILPENIDLTTVDIRYLPSTESVEWEFLDGVDGYTFGPDYQTVDISMTKDGVILLIGVLSILSGIAYTGGPYPLGYNGLGDLFVMVFFGFVAVCGTTFVQVAHVPALALWASVPVGALATAILVVNNGRDRETDVRVGKRTLAVRWGRRVGVVQYTLLLALAYAVPTVLAWRAHDSLVLLPWLTMPWAVMLARQLQKREGASLNATLASTAQLLLAHGVLFCVALTQS